MSNIDYSAVITSEAAARETQLARADAIKGICGQQISEVLDARTLSNLHGAALLKELTRGELATFRAAQRWVRSMQAACRSAIEDGTAPVWPALPDGVAALAKAY